MNVKTIEELIQVIRIYVIAISIQQGKTGI
jgi:hypothetical protein